jgi:putative DNA primase/helicase
MSADQIGIALQGRRNGSGWLVSCPCPNHGKGRGDRSPSLSVTDGDDGRLLLRCFAGCDFIDILHELKLRGIVDVAGKPSVVRLSENPVRGPRTPTTHEPDPEALKIWIAAGPVCDTPVAEYLERRGIALQPPPSLRCGSRGDLPTMVGAVQRPGGKIVAVQSLLLTPEGAKASGSIQRITTGPLGAGAVRLGPAGQVIGLAEGIESGLSAMQLANVPVWVVGCERLHRVELPSCVEEVHIFVDNDTPGVKAAKRTADLHTSAGRRVNLHYPPTQCGDWNDFINLIADADGRDISEPVSDAADLCDGAEKIA